MAKLTEKARFEMVLSILESLKEELGNCLGENLTSIVLYGSYARGQTTVDSDVDILIIAEGLPHSSLERQAIFTKILNELEIPLRKGLHQTGWFPYISAILKTPQEADRISRIYFDMIDEAKIIFDKDGFFRSLLRKVEKKLKELGAKRIQVGEMWYWDLKPDYRPGEIFEI